MVARKFFLLLINNSRQDQAAVAQQNSHSSLAISVFWELTRDFVPSFLSDDGGLILRRGHDLDIDLGRRQRGHAAAHDPQVAGRHTAESR